MTKRSRSGSRKSKKSSGSRFKIPGQIVKVEWGDAHVKSGWGGTNHSPDIVESLGFVIKHDKVGISISKGRWVDPQDNKASPLTTEFIPSGMINNIKVLRQ